jgi:hypothetical protein
MAASNRPSVFAFPNTAKPPAAAMEAQPTAAVVRDAMQPARGEPEMMRTSLYLSRAVHDKLREIAFTERRKVHELFIEGIDKVLAERGFPGTAELRDSSKA